MSNVKLQAFYTGYMEKRAEFPPEANDITGGKINQLPEVKKATLEVVKPVAAKAPATFVDPAPKMSANAQQVANETMQDAERIKKKQATVPAQTVKRVSSTPKDK